jgi:hypothetical protein
LNKNSTDFLSITENAVEISIITSSPSDFPPSDCPTCPGIKHLSSVYRALQIDHTGSSRYFGSFLFPSMIPDITGPIARSSLSILYLSTYQSDYLFVKEYRLEEVAGSLRKNRFEILPFSIDDAFVNLNTPPPTHETPEKELLEFVHSFPKTVSLHYFLTILVAN